ncbi:DUF998 domain-containing protein [Saccharothrix lopnurensis]|uniref:DUF998 domain-containing protein n=1 Tax=Saccharothrix lopnurensis TaxID=1670621 RepID=A0ABW1NYG6_9PSEU
MALPDVPRREPLIAAAVLWALGGAWYLTSEAVAASAFPGYSYAYDYISDLGAVGDEPPGSPLAAVMNLGFLHQGLLFLLGSIFAVRALPASRGRSAFLALAVGYAVGTGLVGVFHSGQHGTPTLHGVGAVMAILGGNLAVVAVGLRFREHATTRPTGTAGVVLGIAGIASLLLLGLNIVLGTPVLFDDGTWERGSVYTITAWQFVAATALLPARRSPTGNEPARGTA